MSVGKILQPGKYVLILISTLTIFNSVNAGNRSLSSPGVAAIFHLWPNLNLVNLECGRKSSLSDRMS